ncbi:hypothetical protein [Chryseobacterium sp.]|uniref:hypothetical protein n=1 Tax=Chryseobacterium sp. TaxID=1871047 RepID=UPI00289E7717|nr:hypothetical protein [Chryseobacterium sp.]
MTVYITIGNFSKKVKWDCEAVPRIGDSVMISDFLSDFERQHTNFYDELKVENVIWGKGKKNINVEIYLKEELLRKIN